MDAFKGKVKVFSLQFVYDLRSLKIYKSLHTGVVKERIRGLCPDKVCPDLAYV